MPIVFQLLLGLVAGIIIICWARYITSIVYERNKQKTENQMQQEADKLNDTLKLQINFISRRLGFNPYDLNNVTKLHSTLSVSYNVNIYCYTVLNHINSQTPPIPGGSDIETVLPPYTLYKLLSAISKSDEIKFKYR